MRLCTKGWFPKNDLVLLNRPSVLSRLSTLNHGIKLARGCYLTRQIQRVLLIQSGKQPLILGANNVNRLRNWLFSKKKNLYTYTSDLNPATRSLPEADKWALSEFILQKLVPVVGIHPYPLDELLLMSSTLAYFKPDIILEWGTHYGKSARIFYEAAVYLNLGTVIHSIDLPPDKEHVENIHEVNQRGVFVRNLPVMLHLGDGLTVARKVLAEGKPNLTLFFVDGDHSYASVQNELSGIKSMAPRAVVLAHDTFLQGSESGYNCGPYKALSEFTVQHRLPLQSTILGLPGMSLTYWL